MSDATIHIIASPQSWVKQAAVDQHRQAAKLDGIDAIDGLLDLRVGRGAAVFGCAAMSIRILPRRR